MKLINGKKCYTLEEAKQISNQWIKEDAEKFTKDVLESQQKITHV